MKTIQIEIPDGKKAEWVNGVLTLIDEEPIECKFKVGDKVMVAVPNSCPQDAIYEITELMERNGEPLYKIEYNGASYRACERYLKLAPQSITERIKTFEDACKWCRENNRVKLFEEHKLINDFWCKPTPDILAYLKLRIITCALNEGWEPTFDGEEARYYPYSYIDTRNLGVDYETSAISFPLKLCFKSEDLAEYAAAQFRDIYADFCGCKKGGEQ